MHTWLTTKLDSKKFYVAVMVTVVIVYLALAVGSSLTKRPWSDEGWFASPALNLITKGSMGTSVLEPAGTSLEGIDRRTYWVMPLYLVTLAGWFKVLGFSLLTMRLYSAAWGLVALASWFIIMKALSGNRKVALLTFALLAFDYIFIIGSSFGRMEVMGSALGFAGLAAYLWFRERNYSLAVLTGHSLVVAGGMTHFNGVLALAGLIFLTFYFDRARFRWRHVSIAAAPYLVGAVGWGVYILQDPSLFFTQFRGNATVGGRMSGLTSPWLAPLLEIKKRYLVAFGFGPHSVGHSGPIRLKIFILAAYVISLLGAILTRGIRQHKGHRALLILAAIYFVIMTFLDGQKLTYYLVYIIPIYTAILAVWINWCWTKRLVPTHVMVLGICGLIALQVGGLVYRMKLDVHRTSYMPAVNFLKNNSDETTLIMGSAELGFELGFDGNLVDDTRLGYDSGKRPDLIVVDEVYKDAFRGKQLHNPEIYEHITRRLTEEYERVYNHANYEVYARK